MLNILKQIEHKIITLNDIPYHLREHFNLSYRQGLVQSVSNNMSLLENYYLEKCEVLFPSSNVYSSNSLLKKYIDDIEYLKKEGKNIFPKLIEGYGYLSSFVNLILLTKNVNQKEDLSKRIKVNSFVVCNTSTTIFKNLDQKFIQQVLKEYHLLSSFVESN